MNFKGVNFYPDHVLSFKNADDFVKNESADSKAAWADLFGITDADLKEVYDKCKAETTTPAEAGAEAGAIEGKKANGPKATGTN